MKNTKFDKHIQYEINEISFKIMLTLNQFKFKGDTNKLF